MTLKLLPSRGSARVATALLLACVAVGTQASAQGTKSAAPIGAAQQSPYNGSVVEDILVRVNDQIISRSDFERADQQLQAEAKQQGIPAGDVEVRRKDLLRDLIDTQLLLSKGKELGVTGETELVRRLDDIRKQNKLESMEALEKAASDQGVSFEDFKANIRNGIITQSVIRDEVGRRIQLTPSEVQRFYQTHKTEFDQPEQVRLSEILIPTASNAPQVDKSAPAEVDPAKLAEAKAKADEVYAKLKAGESFEQLSKAVSSAPTAQEGGDLGSFKRGLLAKELEDKTFPLKVGEVTEPIRTKQGYVLLKVTEHVQPGTGQTKEMQGQVEEAAYMDRMQPALRQYLRTLREQAYIDIKPGFVDSGASPNQTKPVYSAYAPPAVKKKRTTRTRYRQTSFRGKSRTTASAALPSAGAGSAAPVVATSDGGATTAGTSNGLAPAGSAAAEASPGSTTPLPAAPSAAAKTPTMKAGKREKVRFGQAPRETLPAAAQTEHEDAGAGSAVTATTGSPETAAAPSANTEIAAAAMPVNPLEPAVERGDKRRYAARAKLPKVKKPSGPQADPFAPPPVTTDETASQQTQSAPLGLSGNTARPKKVKAEKGDKRRYAGKEKPADAPPSTPLNAPAGVTPAGSAQLPAPEAAAPASTSPASANAGSTEPDRTTPNTGAPDPSAPASAAPASTTTQPRTTDSAKPDAGVVAPGTTAPSGSAPATAVPEDTAPPVTVPAGPAAQP